MPVDRGAMVSAILRIVFPLYVGFIVVLSVVPRGPELPGGAGDKLAHFGAYALMALLGMPLTRSLQGLWRMLFAVVAIGATLELVQLAVPSRTASALDLVADAMGAVAGTGLWVLLRRVVRRQLGARAEGASR